MSKQKKQGRKSFVRNLCSGVERLEDKIMLSFFSWVTSTYDKYVAPVVQKVVNVEKAVIKTVEKAATAVYKEVEQHISEPIVKTAKKVSKAVERAVDVAIDHVSREIDSGIRATVNLVKTGESIASNIEKTVDSATPSVPGGVIISTELDIIAGIYDGVKGAVTGVTDLANDGYYAIIGQVTNPEKAKETVDKWSVVVDQVMADPTVIVTSVIDSYVKEGNPGRIIGRILPDGICLIIGVGEANAALKGAKALKGIEAVSDVAKVASKSAKVADIATDVAKVGSSYTNKAVKATKTVDEVFPRILPDNPGKWNMETVVVKVKTRAKKIPEIQIRERLDFSGVTHSRKSPKNVEPHINVDILDSAGNKLKSDIVNHQLPGFNGMGYGGRFFPRSLL